MTALIRRFQKERAVTDRACSHRCVRTFALAAVRVKRKAYLRLNSNLHHPRNPRLNRSLERRRRLAISSRLDAVKLGVWAAPGHELVVGADLGDARAVEYDDEVGHANRAEPV